MKHPTVVRKEQFALLANATFLLSILLFAREEDRSPALTD